MGTCNSVHAVPNPAFYYVYMGNKEILFCQNDLWVVGYIKYMAEGSYIVRMKNGRIIYLKKKYSKFVSENYWNHYINMCTFNH